MDWQWLYPLRFIARGGCGRLFGTGYNTSAQGDPTFNWSRRGPVLYMNYNNEKLANRSLRGISRGNNLRNWGKLARVWHASRWSNHLLTRVRSEARIRLGVTLTFPGRLWEGSGSWKSSYQNNINISFKLYSGLQTDPDSAEDLRMTP